MQFVVFQSDCKKKQVIAKNREGAPLHALTLKSVSGKGREFEKVFVSNILSTIVDFTVPGLVFRVLPFRI